jgi:hypothetical protein
MNLASPATVRPSTGYKVTTMQMSVQDLNMTNSSGQFLRPYITIVPDVVRHTQILPGNDVLVCAATGTSASLNNECRYTFMRLFVWWSR